MADASGFAQSTQKEVLFDVSKKELGTPQSTYKKLFRKLRSEFRCNVNKDLISLDRLKEASLVIFAGPRELFTSDEFTSIKKYIISGGSVLFALGEGGESKFNTNVGDEDLHEEDQAVVRGTSGRGGLISSRRQEPPNFLSFSHIR